MRKQASRKPIWERVWVKAAFLLLSGLLLFLLERRKNQGQAQDDQPVVWRRDIEMGPTDVKEPVAAPQPAATPETRAGESLAAETIADTAPKGKRAAAKDPVPPSKAATPAGDDLVIIEGIGPKINSLLQQAGIRAFAQLAEATPERLSEILRAAGLRLANPETWPEQARLAAQGDWSALETYQKQLKGGRKV